VRILVVNPNSSTSITDRLSESIEPPPGVQLAWWTAPSEAPSSIDDEETSDSSTAVCLPRILELCKSAGNAALAGGGVESERLFDGILIACYSDHPLIALLRTHLVDPPIHVLGILEASVAHALLLPQPAPLNKFGIITTGQTWEPVLGSAVKSFLGVTESERFAGVRSTGIGVLGFHGPDVDAGVGKAVQELVKDGVGVIILGCAGMSGLEANVKRAASATRVGSSRTRTVLVVDGVRAGIQLLVGLIRYIAMHFVQSRIASANYYLLIRASPA
jgi:Asp/Glu/hydantoin racemase